MANPALNEKLFKRVDAVVDTSRMSINGSVNKTGILLLIAIAGASVGWSGASPVLLVAAFLGTLILSMLIIFGPQRAVYLSQAYAFGEGVLLGTISATYAEMFPGIVFNALALTLGCLGFTLILYRARIVTVTDKFRSVIIVSTLAICMTYIVDMIMGMFGSGMMMIHQGSTVGIIFSGVVVVVAAMNLFLDFDMIEKLNQRGAPKYMEWYCGFALLVTLVWLYLEILRLLSKLNRK